MYWPADDQYYPGQVTKVTDSDPPDYHVAYTDGDRETLNLNDETWRYTDDPALHANAIELVSKEQSDLRDYLKFFGHKDFMKSHAQGLPSYVMQRAYKREEAAFKKTVKCVPISEFPANANIISSHVIYKVKLKDDDDLDMNSRIAPHGHKDVLRFELKTDSAT